MFVKVCDMIVSLLHKSTKSIHTCATTTDTPIVLVSQRATMRQEETKFLLQMPTAIHTISQQIACLLPSIDMSVILRSVQISLMSGT